MYINSIEDINELKAQMIDCFDGMPISRTLVTSPNAELANTMLKKLLLHLGLMKKQLCIQIEDVIIVGLNGLI